MATMAEGGISKIVSVEESAVGKVRRRLLPFCMLLFLMNHLDRVNVGFAALRMNQDLGFGPEVFGLGAGVFFIGYFIFEVPSNLILDKVGARRWIACLLVVWGLLSAAMALVTGTTSFFLLRFFLGFAEAGFLPGILFYLSQWFPRREQARAIGIFMSATALAVVIGSPISSAFLAMDGWLGLKGWQLLFIFEGLPAVLLGFVTWYFLTDTPAEAQWLTADERKGLSDTIAQERRAAEAGQKDQRWWVATFRNPMVYLISAICFFLTCGIFGVLFWTPQIIKSLGNLSVYEAAMLTSLPFLMAAIAMVFWGRSSDRSGERKWHLAGAAAVGAVGLAASALLPTGAPSFIALCFAAVGIWSTFGVFWTLPTSFLTGTAAAAGLAFINSFGALGGFTGPYLVGLLRAQTGTFTGSLIFLSVMVLAVALLSALLPAQLLRRSK